MKMVNGERQCNCGKTWDWDDDKQNEVDQDGNGAKVKRVPGNRGKDYTTWTCPSCNDFLGECGDPISEDNDWS